MPSPRDMAKRFDEVAKRFAGELPASWPTSANGWPSLECSLEGFLAGHRDRDVA